MTDLFHRVLLTLRISSFIEWAAARFGVGIFICHDITCTGFLDFEARDGEWWGFGLHLYIDTPRLSPRSI